MKRILFISPRLASGGGERQLVTIARLLKQRGYYVEVLCYSYGNFYEDLLHKDGIPVYWIQHNYLLRLITCTWFILKGKYDDVISFLPTPSFINCFAAMIHKRGKVIAGERSCVINKPKTMRQKFTIWLYRYSDSIVCNSENAQRLWEEIHPQYKHKLTTIYNTVITNIGNCKYTAKFDNKLHICIAATIYEIKNPIGLLKAILLMSDKERETIVIDWYGSRESAIGDRKEYDAVCRLIEENHLENILRLHDATKDIANRMVEADVVALFSRIEGLPNAICEAMMIGKPILMTKVSDYIRLVEEGKNGYLCDWDNPITIKDKILKLATMSTDSLIRMGEESKLIANSLFSKERVINEWVKIL